MLLLDYWHDAHVASLVGQNDSSHNLLFDYWHDAQIASLVGQNSFSHEYLINDAGNVSPAYGTTSSSSTTNSGTHSTNSSAPAPTLVGSPNGFQIDLIWDSSVANAPPGFEQAVIDAAEYYTTLFSNKAVINIDVGYGEIAGSSLAPDALGESESYGYLVNYNKITHVLAGDGDTFAATNEPTDSKFFVTSAEAKALGHKAHSSALDGYIGFSTLSRTGYSWNTAADSDGSNSGTGANQFDLESVALHEISEVMGRIGMEGEIVNGKPTDTPQDLFNFQSPGVLESSPNGGYFSVNDGTANLGTYNDASVNGGDIADWASSTSTTQSNTTGLPTGVNVYDAYDAYDAFTFPDYNGDVSQSDILELTALGYKLTPTGEVAV
jgi:hypothetical protein